MHSIGSGIEKRVKIIIYNFSKSCQKMLDNFFSLCYNKGTIGGRNMEIVTLIISAVVQVALAIGFFVVYTQYQKATKIARSLEREIEKLTQPNLVSLNPETYNVISRWLKACGVTQVGITLKYDKEKQGYRALIYTDRAGYLIGKAGCKIEAVKKELAELKQARNIINVEINEVCGFVNQREVDVDAYYSAYMVNWHAYEEAGEEEM